MGDNFSNHKSILQLPFHRLEEINDGVTITKNKAILNRKLLFGLLLIALMLFTLWSLLGKSPYAFLQPPSWNRIMVLVSFGIIVGVTLYLSFRRTKRLVSDFKLTRQGNNLYINDKPLALSVNGGQPIVVIQDVAGSGGVGGSSTVGISVGKKFWGLCYELDKADAKKAAKCLSENLDLAVEERESVAFPLFKLH